MGVTAGIVEFADLNNTSQEGPHLVRLKKAGLRASNQWSIDAALRGWRAYIICRFWNWSGDLFGG